jgi:hypothetical protein
MFFSYFYRTYFMLHIFNSLYSGGYSDLMWNEVTCLAVFKVDPLVQIC